MLHHVRVVVLLATGVLASVVRLASRVLMVKIGRSRRTADFPLENLTRSLVRHLLRVVHCACLRSLLFLDLFLTNMPAIVVLDRESRGDLSHAILGHFLTELADEGTFGC